MLQHSKSKILDLKALNTILGESKRRGEKIVFTNGCFDILHPGHIDLLVNAAKLGDVLVVGLNDNSSVSRLKGEKRPIFDVRDRVSMLSALEVVDFVITFSEDTPIRLIETILPDVLVKGNDYKIDNIVGADIVLANGGKVEVVPLKKGYSTTTIIEKLKD